MQGLLEVSLCVGIFPSEKKFYSHLCVYISCTEIKQCSFLFIYTDMVESYVLGWVSEIELLPNIYVLRFPKSECKGC